MKFMTPHRVALHQSKGVAAVPPGDLLPKLWPLTVGREEGGGGTLLSLICDVMPPNKAFLQSVPCHLHFSESALRFSLLLFACHRAPLHCIAFRSISSRILMTRPVCNVIASLKTTSRVLELERKSVTYTNHMDVVN